ncbi:hypothetical protein FQA47_019743 [Oryzias melastigma]|uniref:Uncharacterized protein n=1 Tax=Oryzias melastigma TaxID=30732 RepID=A0A834KZQ2_ORYME|nr:hypothetical protein FQA47_019743 [Oryzias melastigma]
MDGAGFDVLRADRRPSWPAEEQAAHTRASGEKKCRLLCAFLRRKLRRVHAEELPCEEESADHNLKVCARACLCVWFDGEIRSAAPKPLRAADGTRAAPGESFYARASRGDRVKDRHRRGGRGKLRAGSGSLDPNVSPPGLCRGWGPALCDRQAIGACGASLLRGFKQCLADLCMEQRM